MRRKLEKFADVARRDNVIQPGKALYERVKGRWHGDYFKNNNPIVTELACGRGEYTVGLAQVYPNKNFIGVDIKGDRIWKGSGIAIDEHLENVAFLRTQVDHLENFFEPGEIADIWITFPDPRPKDRDEKRRLTHPRFLEIYKKLMMPAGWLHLKTDNTGLFNYTLEALNDRDDISGLVYTYDLYQSSYIEEHHGIKTRYELKFNEAGHNIKYLKFQFQH